MGREMIQRGPGGISYYYPPEGKIASLYRKGMDVERIAYGMGKPTAMVKDALGRTVNDERERDAWESILSQAREMVIEGHMNFFDARDRIEVHADTLVAALEEAGQADEAVDALAIREADAPPYAAKAYKSMLYDIGEVARAVECTEREARLLLGSAYDPYAMYRLDKERGDKARRLYGEGLSAGQVAFRLKADKWDVEYWVGEDLMKANKARTRREVRSRFGSGESLRDICADIGIRFFIACDYVNGMYEHALDLYGVDAEARKRLCDLYRDEGLETSEIASMTGLEAKVVQMCLDDFCYADEDEKAHRVARERRLERDGEILIVQLEPRAEEDESALLEAASKKTAERAGIEEELARRFFEGRPLPSRARLARDMGLRSRFARAMFDQGKSIAQIAEFINVQEPIVEKYLGDDYAPIKDAMARSRDRITLNEAAISLYRAGVPFKSAARRAGYTSPQSPAIMGDSLMWKHPLCDWHVAQLCEIRYLMAFCGMSIVDAAAHFGCSLHRAQKMMGSYDWRRGASVQRLHAMAAYARDALHLDRPAIASLLGVTEEVVNGFLDDDRDVADPEWSRNWRAPSTGSASFAVAAASSGIDEGIIERAVGCSLIGGDRTRREVDSMEFLEAMGITNQRPLPALRAESRGE